MSHEEVDRERTACEEEYGRKKEKKELVGRRILERSEGHMGVAI